MPIKISYPEHFSAGVYLSIQELPPQKNIDRDKNKKTTRCLRVSGYGGTRKSQIRKPNSEFPFHTRESRLMLYWFRTHSSAGTRQTEKKKIRKWRFKETGTELQNTHTYICEPHTNTYVYTPESRRANSYTNTHGRTHTHTHTAYPFNMCPQPSNRGHRRCKSRFQAKKKRREKRAQ